MARGGDGASSKCGAPSTPANCAAARLDSKLACPLQQVTHARRCTAAVESEHLILDLFVGERGALMLAQVVEPGRGLERLQIATALTSIFVEAPTVAAIAGARI